MATRVLCLESKATSFISTFLIQTVVFAVSVIIFKLSSFIFETIKCEYCVFFSAQLVLTTAR